MWMSGQTGTSPDRTGGFCTRYIDLMAKTSKRDALIESVQKTFAAGLTLVERKNRDYGAGNDAFRNFRTAGVVGLSVEKAILVRVLDKISRIDNLLEHEAYVTEESMEDTVVDAINYLAILKAYRECHRPTALTTEGAPVAVTA